MDEEVNLGLRERENASNFRAGRMFQDNWYLDKVKSFKINKDIAKLVEFEPIAFETEDELADALNEHIIDEDAFLEQCQSIHQEREIMFFDALEKRISNTRLKLREIGHLNDDPDLMNAAIAMADNIDDMAQKHLTKLISFKAQGEDYKVQAFQESIPSYLDAEIQMFDRHQKDFALKHGFQVDRRPMKLPF